DDHRLAEANRPGGGEHRPSMGQDMVKGRRTEIQFLNGFVVRKGEDVSIATPTNAILTDIVTRVERGELEPDPRHITDLRLNERRSAGRDEQEGAADMLAVVNTPNGKAPVEIREVAEPQPAPNEAVVEVRAFSLNRGELRLFQIRPEGWRPGQDIGGVVIRPAANGSGPEAGARGVAPTPKARGAQRGAPPAPPKAGPPRHRL